MTDIIPLVSRSADTIANVRWASAGALEWFEIFEKCARRRRKGIAAALTVEKITFRYARWLGDFHGARGGVPCFIREIDRLRRAGLLGEAHCQALGSIEECITMLDEYAASPHPWLSLPNHASTQFNALRMLDAVIGQCEAIILHLRRLQGHQPDERISA